MLPRNRIKRLTIRTATKLLGVTLPLIILASFWGTVAAAQEQTSWEAAELIHELGFQAQKEMYAAERTDRPEEHHKNASDFLKQASLVYGESLQPKFATLAPEANIAINEAIDTATEAASQGNGVLLAAARGHIWTGLLGGSYSAAISSLKANDAAAAERWLNLREYRQATRFTILENHAVQAVGIFRNEGLSLSDALSEIDNDLLDAYYYRLRDALNSMEDAANKEFAVRSAEWAGLASGYYNILHRDFTEKLGTSASTSLSEAISAVEKAVISGELNSAGEMVANIRLLLSNYQPVELTPAEINERAKLFYTFLDMVDDEFGVGVRDGKIVILIEYQEAITFRDQAQSIFEELYPAIAAKNPVEAERLKTLLETMQSVILAVGDNQHINDMVPEALRLIEDTLGVAGNSIDSSSAFSIVGALLDKVIEAVQQNNYQDAERARLEAYAIFESGPELTLSTRSPKLSRALEGMFWEGTGGEKGLAVLIKEAAPVSVIKENITNLKTKLGEAEKLLITGVSGIPAALNSAAIIIREGLEAVLIIGAILGYLRATQGQRRYIIWVYAGVSAAILLSLLTWWVAQSLINITPANRELIEGIASLVAVAVLFYITNWLFHKVYVLDWAKYIKEKVGKAVTGGSALALTGLGFTVVYREGFETVLFYQALLFDTPPLPVLLGFLAGLSIIIAVAYFMLKSSKRMPIKPFFNVTGALLLLLAFSFTGAGIREFQEAGIVNVTLINWMPENLFLMQTLGIVPTLETTLAQAFFLLLVAGTFAYSRWSARISQNRLSMTAQEISD